MFIINSQSKAGLVTGAAHLANNIRRKAKVYEKPAGVLRNTWGCCKPKAQYQHLEELGILTKSSALPCLYPGSGLKPCYGRIPHLCPTMGHSEPDRQPRNA